MNNKLTIGTLIISLVLLFGCNKEELSEKNAFDLFRYRQTYATDFINPAITEFVSDVKKLNEATTKFTTQTNQENLLNLQNLWKNAALSYAKTEVGNLGDIQSSAIYISMYSWGANEYKIEEFVAATETIDENSVNKLPTKTRGLSAVEYLLFNGDAMQTVSSFSDVRRKDFLIALNKNLLIKATSLKEQWEVYSDYFINNTATGITGSVNLIVNQLNFLLEDVLRFKIGEPAGLDNTSSTNTTVLQAYRSEISLAIIQKNITAVKAVYYGMPDGLDDYVREIATTEDINNAITASFSSIEANMASLSNTTLKKAIENKNTTVAALHKHIKELIILIKVDVASTLSVTVTFTDNDGD